MFPYSENKIQIFIMFNHTMHVKVMSGLFTKTTVIVSYIGFSKGICSLH